MRFPSDGATPPSSGQDPLAAVSCLTFLLGSSPEDSDWRARADEAYAPGLPLSPSPVERYLRGALNPCLV